MMLYFCLNRQVLEIVAAIHNENVESLAGVIYDNTRNLFHLSWH